MFSIRTTTDAQLQQLASRLKPLDAAECRAWGETPAGFLKRAFRESTLFVVEHHLYGIVAISGYIRQPGTDYATVWLLNTESVDKCKLEYLRNSEWMWKEGFRLAGCAVAGNLVWSEQKEHLEWLGRCGAVIDMGNVEIVNGQRFYRFTMTKEDIKWRSRPKEH